MNMLWPWILTRLQDSMLSVKTHLLHTFQTSTEVSGLVAVLFFCNQDPWSWIVAVLRDSMLSDITHLLHTFKFYLFFWCHGCRAPASHSCRRPWPHCAWCGSVLHSLVRCKSFIIPGIETGTVHGKAGSGIFLIRSRDGACQWPGCGSCQDGACVAMANYSSCHASAGNRARVTSMATMYSATRPLMRLTPWLTGDDTVKLAAAFYS